MDRRRFFPILLIVFCITVFVWLCETIICIHCKIPVSDICSLHGVCFFSALAIFILMLIVLDITREDYARNKELDDIEVEKKRILFEDWKRKREMSSNKRLCIRNDKIRDQGEKEEETSN